MTSYHKTHKGVWTRCRAVKRRGSGVAHCPIGASSHRKGLEGIAAAAAEARTPQKLLRWIADDTYRETIVSVPNGPVFEASTGKRKGVFNLKDGKRVGLKERVKAARKSSVSEVDSKWYEEAREHFATFKVLSEKLRDPERQARGTMTSAWDGTLLYRPREEVESRIRGMYAYLDNHDDTKLRAYTDEFAHHLRAVQDEAETLYETNELLKLAGLDDPKLKRR